MCVPEAEATAVRAVLENCTTQLRMFRDATGDVQPELILEDLELLMKNHDKIRNSIRKSGRIAQHIK